MPSRNIIRDDEPASFYHVYARGASKQPIFLADTDYQFFLSLFARHLSIKQRSSRLTVYPHLRGRVELLAFCLMPNHFHLLLYQAETSAVTHLMQSVMTSYSRYFNTKYKRSGSLFESRFKASRIASETYLLHISRYIHLNPRYYKRYPYSSYRYYTKTAPMEEWFQPERVTNLFLSPQAYSEFVADYEDNKAVLDEIRNELAG